MEYFLEYFLEYFSKEKIMKKSRQQHETPSVEDEV